VTFPVSHFRLGLNVHLNGVHPRNISFTHFKVNQFVHQQLAYGNNRRKLVPIEINGALYSSTYQDSSKLAHSYHFNVYFCALLVHINLHREISELWHKISFRKITWAESGEGASIMKLKNACISTKTNNFILAKNAEHM